MPRRQIEFSEFKAQLERESHSYMLLHRLELEFKHHKPHDGSYALDIFPVKLVAVLEVFTREEIASLISHGSPFVERVSRLMERIRLDPEIIQAIVKEPRLSVGQYIALHFNVSNLEELLTYLYTLCPELEAQINAAAAAQKIKAKIAQLFKVRHILCHEGPDVRPYNVDEIPEFFSSVEGFIKLVSSGLHMAKYGHEISYAFSRDRLYSEQKSTRQRLQAIQEKARELATDDENRQLISNVVGSWEQYREAWCMLSSDRARGGTLRGQLYAGMDLGLMNKELTLWDGQIRASEWLRGGPKENAYRVNSKPRETRNSED